MYLIQILASEYCHLTAIGLYSWKPNPNVRSVGKKGNSKNLLEDSRNELPAHLLRCQIEGQQFQTFLSVLAFGARSVITGCHRNQAITFHSKEKDGEEASDHPNGGLDEYCGCILDKVGDSSKTILSVKESADV